MAKFVIYTVIVFCFGLFAKLEHESISTKETPAEPDTKSILVLQKTGALETKNTVSEAYKIYLEVLDEPGPKEESVLQSKAIVISRSKVSSDSSTLKAKTTNNQDNIIVQQKLENVATDTEINNPLNIIQKRIDHSAFGFLLQKYVNTKGDVDYAAFKRDQGKLEIYLNTLSTNPAQESWTENERLAYYINVYNAYTIKLILDNYPVSSIMDINNGKPWDKAFIKLGSNNYSLNNIENDIIRKDFDEPRIHFAVNCAATSCPPLLNDAFYPDKLDAQLERQTVAFVNNSAYNSLTPSKVKLSKIFDWYGSDFNELKEYLKKYAKIDVSNSEIVFNEYDWSLNSQ